MHVEWGHGLPQRLEAWDITGLEWGVETSDRKSFFTLTDRALGCTVIRQAESQSEDEAHLDMDVRMHEGEWNLKVESQRLGPAILTRQRLTCTAPAVLQDFVLRYKFPERSFLEGEISGHRIRHENRNIWHQYPAREVILRGARSQARITLLSVDGAEVFDARMYIRDEPGSWIVHARLLPREPCQQHWIRWHNRWFKLELNEPLAGLLMSSQRIKRWLWHLSERRGGRPQLQAQCLANLEKGQFIGLKAKIEFDRLPA